MAKIPISITIITRNEEENIFDCLNNLHSFDDIILVDSGSKDKTLEIAKKFKNVKIFSNPLKDFSGQKNLAASIASYEWILNIDADERPTKELIGKIHGLIIDNKINKYDLYEIRFREYKWGKFMKYGGWSRYHARLYNRKKTKFIHQVHELLDKHGCKIGKLHEPILHFSHTSLAKTLKKFNLYTELEAKEMLSKNPKPNNIFLFTKAIFVFKMRFWHHLIFRKAILDGWHGILASFLLGFYYFLVYIKYFELAYRRNKK